MNDIERARQKRKERELRAEAEKIGRMEGAELQAFIDQFVNGGAAALGLELEEADILWLRQQPYMAWMGPDPTMGTLKVLVEVVREHGLRPPVPRIRLVRGE